MQTYLVNTRTLDVTVNDELKDLEREWVIALLASRRGVESVLTLDHDPRRLLVQYDADRASGLDLLDCLHVCGVRARVTPRTAARAG
jgi:hypothetical protein